MLCFPKSLKSVLCLVTLAISMIAGPLDGERPVMAQTSEIGPSGLPIPRFVSLKSDRVNVRKGPSRDHDVTWTYVHAGLPVEIIQEFENWRRIRDWEGQIGWVFHSLLSSRRTALVTPWDENLTTPLRASADSGAAMVAELQALVLVTIRTCKDGWCRVNGENFDGWIDQKRLFGAYDGEAIE